MSTVGQENTQKTLFHSLTEIHRSMGVNYTPNANTTYNQRMTALDNYVGGGSHPSPAIQNGPKYPQIKYLAIGRGAHRVVAGDQTGSLIDIAKHRCSDASPFEPIPWIIRPVGSDLTPGEQANYRLRVVLDLGQAGVCACYFLKVIDLGAINPTVDVITVQDGEITNSTPFDFVAQENAMQDPVAPTQSNIETNLINGQHIKVSGSVSIALTEQDINEIIEAVEAIYGDISYATISEFGVVQGIDQTVTLPIDGVSGPTTEYVEALQAQITTHIGVTIPLQGRPTSINNTYALSDVIPWPDVTP